MSEIRHQQRNINRDHMGAETKVIIASAYRQRKESASTLSKQSGINLSNILTRIVQLLSP